MWNDGVLMLAVHGVLCVCNGLAMFDGELLRLQHDELAIASASAIINSELHRHLRKLCDRHHLRTRHQDQKALRR